MIKPWVELAKISIVDPRRGAALVLAEPLPQAAVPLLLVLLACLNGMLYTLLLPPTLAMSPIAMAVVSGAIIWVSAWLLTKVGGMMGGQGSLPRVLQAVLFLQCIRLAAQVALLLLSILLPPVAGMVSMVAGIWGIYMMVCFLAEAHHFDNRLKALGALGAVFVVTLVVLSVLLTLLGGEALTDL